MRKTYLAATLLSFVVLANPAHALFGDDEARKAILELRNQLQSQQDVQMKLYERIEKLSKEVQTLRGQLEVLNNSYGKQQNLYGDLQNQINEMDPKAKAAQEAQDREIAARQDMDAALKLVNKGSYDQAIKSFLTFGQKYQSTNLYPESLYWLGSSYYGKGQFAKAIEVENRLISKYPKNAKVPEAMLILGMAQMDSKKKAEAKATFDKLIKMYPKSEAAKVAKSQR